MKKDVLVDVGLLIALSVNTHLHLMEDLRNFKAGLLSSEKEDWELFIKRHKSFDNTQGGTVAIVCHLSITRITISTITHHILHFHMAHLHLHHNISMDKEVDGTADMTIP